MGPQQSKPQNPKTPKPLPLIHGRYKLLYINIKDDDVESTCQEIYLASRRSWRAVDPDLPLAHAKLAEIL
jgi:hypothetical protein